MATNDEIRELARKFVFFPKSITAQDHAVVVDLVANKNMFLLKISQTKNTRKICVSIPLGTARLMIVSMIQMQYYLEIGLTLHPSTTCQKEVCIAESSDKPLAVQGACKIFSTL